MSLPDTQHTDVDKEFSNLESLAFRGEWDFKERQRVWELYGMEGVVDHPSGTSPEHDRIQKLMGVYSAMDCYNKDNSRTFRALAETNTRNYLSRYPSSAEQLPDDLPFEIDVEKIQMDLEFTMLEELAFQGDWDEDEEERICRLFNTAEAKTNGDATTPAHTRLQRLGIVMTAVQQRKEDPEGTGDVAHSYMRQYTSARKQLPAYNALMREADKRR